jgi:hypothetical protein
VRGSHHCAYRSTTTAEVATLTRDLGSSPPAAPPARRRSVMPGNRPFAVRQLDEHKSVVDVFGQASLRVRRTMADLEDAG